MRICTVKSTGKIIEAQSCATAGTLIRNAVGAGYAKADVEERDIAESEYAILVSAQKEESKTCADKRRDEYPPMADYLDAVVKGDEEQKQAYIDKCLAVKAKYPKTQPE